MDRIHLIQAVHAVLVVVAILLVSQLSLICMGMFGLSSIVLRLLLALDSAAEVMEAPAGLPEGQQRVYPLPHGVVTPEAMERLAL